jgi:hypothetical protein
VAVLGLLLYVPVYVAYESFYRGLGVAPDEVGLTYTAALSREITWFASSVVVLCVAGGTLAVAAWLAFRPARLWTLLKFPGRPSAPARRVSAIAALLTVTLIIVLVVYQVQSVPKVESGVPAAPQARSFFKARADLVQVAWIDKSPAGVSVPQRMLYLGQSNGVAVFWDARSASSVRIPTGSITIQSFPGVKRYYVKGLNEFGSIWLVDANSQDAFDDAGRPPEDRPPEEEPGRLGGLWYPEEDSPGACSTTWGAAVQKAATDTLDYEVLAIVTDGLVYLFSVPDYRLVNADLVRQGLTYSPDPDAPDSLRRELAGAAKYASTQKMVKPLPC